MTTKNARQLGLRLDSEDDKRLTKFEQETHVEPVSLARAALKAALTAYEEQGSLSLPLRVISQAQYIQLQELDKSKASLTHNLAQQTLDPVEQKPCADSAPSTAISPTTPQTNPKAANIVQLPPPPVLATLLHDTTKAAEKTNPPPVTEERQEVTYTKKPRRKS